MKSAVVSAGTAISAFSLLRGSGLKYDQLVKLNVNIRVLPLTREWIEIRQSTASISFFIVLPLTREWIEIFFKLFFKPFRGVLPLTREWIEILFLCSACVSLRSPSYEGVD